MKNVFRHLVVAFVGLISLIYLINPTAGIIEFIPDNIPFVGNVDEGLATILLISAIRYFGIDLSKVFGQSSSK